MKKLFFVVALLAVVASCTKNEVIPQNDGNKEITYLTAPLTKASSFGITNKFYSYAYLLTSGNWETGAGSSTPYINGAKISYSDNQWKAATAYYWPKDANSKLTFFAWGDGTPDPALVMGDCSNTTGIVFVNYNVADSKNKDLMVAKIAADQKNNTPSVDPYGKDGVTQGVPTLFYHVLSSLEIKAKKAENYPQVTFNVKNITLLNNSVKGSYTQGVDATKLPTAGTWAQASPVVTADLQVYNNTGFTLTTSAEPLAATDADYRILLPHTFGVDEKMQITYEIVTEYISGHPVTETVTFSQKLSDIFGASWEAGKKYTLTIILDMKEILWDPAVEVWDLPSGDWNI